MAGEESRPPVCTRLTRRRIRSLAQAHYSDIPITKKAQAIAIDLARLAAVAARPITWMRNEKRDALRNVLCLNGGRPIGDRQILNVLPRPPHA